ncbi:MAG: Undecaprenyl-phosphate mannosyltransferase [Microgenomates group bacterium ADurb.Bin219]|nr:MAG: Undecaprenyl-phosphate mannosyltransferase [Microgenomates group bacterium ADurb.Bin219]
MKNHIHFLSVVIPAYLKEKTITQDIERVIEVLDRIRYDYEIVVVVDGREDRTYEEAKKIKSKKVKVISYKKNRGKGYAVRYGMARTRGDLIAFIDAGMEIDPNGISMILEHMEWYNADIIVGSKRHPASQVNYPRSRKIISWLYQLFVRFFTGLNVRDTQAGLKIYKRRVLEAVLPRLAVKRYAFDLEMLAVANHLGFKKIYEAPIKLNYNFTDLTHAGTPKWMLNAFIDTLAIIYRLNFLHYYDDKNKKRWYSDPRLIFKK